MIRPPITSRDLSDDNDSVDAILFACVGIGADDDSADSLSTPHGSAHCALPRRALRIPTTKHPLLPLITSSVRSLLTLSSPMSRDVSQVRGLFFAWEGQEADV
ncbi:hypothetical protein BLNAU_19579 [Blattamonas nauphoetae]|uniref:Uncharacterized protein n=1 Tax=Blattamonas nauphoetae TaxID=2049346 RepID=A0ABQ9WZS6_9EUKA|nr:hypothetical protein BLNAU_20032 [Blattamonas nauphoetae]KAK2945506.1 hypothetical protein BLNAU_19579 [Blattamonas nauphoetae]